MSEIQADFDNTWKEALRLYFEQFLALLFPAIHEFVDWGRPPIPLDTELQQVLGEAEAGKRLADKLFQVWLKDGSEAWVLIHVEVQSQQQSDFDKRMYQYNYRAFEIHDRKVISLAVLGDENPSWRPFFYGYALDGFELSFRFPVAKLWDYNLHWESLEANPNPFAVMVMAHLKTKATVGNFEERKEWKWNLVRGLFERGYTGDDLRELFRLIDAMMRLPVELQGLFKRDVISYQEVRKMPFLSQVEEEAMELGMQRGIEQGIERGIEQGIERGIEQGIQRGILQDARESVFEVLQVRFNEIPASLREAVNNIEDTALLKQLLRQAITIVSIEDFQQLLR